MEILLYSGLPPLKVIFCVVDETGEIAGGRLTDRIGIGVLTRVVPRDLVNEVLAETRRREKRSRLLPAHVVVYFVMAMAIFRDGYEEVMRRLTGGLVFMRAWSQDWSVPTTGAISQARERLGEAPVKLLFEKVAAPLAVPGAPGAWLGHRRLMAIDGVKLDAPDTAANLAWLGRPGGLTRRPFPQVQVLGLGECGTHAVVAAQIGTLGVGERELAAGLLEAMGPDMLVIADRGFFSFEFWRDCLLTGADLLFRVPAGPQAPGPAGPARRVVPVRSAHAQGTRQRLQGPAGGGRRPAQRHPHPGPGHRVHRLPGPARRDARDVPADHHDHGPGRRDRRRAGRRLRPALGIRDIAARDRDPDARARRRAPVEIPRTAAAGTMGPAAGPLRHTIADGRGRRLGRPGPGPAVVHAKYQPRPPPGHRPGGIFPPEGSDEPAKQRSRRSSNESVKAAASGPTRASSRSTKDAPSR